MAKTVLIVEDNELNMKLFHDLLEAHGYKTVGTRNGNEALDLARRHRPDLILMDIQLPEVSGLDVTKWLKADPVLKAIPVIAVTAFAMKGDEERIRQGGCEAYLSKPISVAKFIETVRQFLGVGLIRKRSGARRCRVRPQGSRERVIRWPKAPSQRWISGRLALGSLCGSDIALARGAAHEARAIKLLVTLRNAQVRRISWVP